MEQARLIVKALADAGHQAYIVGGAVRDLLLGKSSQDIDIATSASADEIRQAAAAHGWGTVEVGAAFGVIIVVVGETTYDVATFRAETYGEDSHRPEQVQLGVSLTEDLQRRDFTMNAMALDIDGNIIDLFGGRDDIAAKLIRTVGNPYERFAEDALRMFRAARFAACFGFRLDPAAQAAFSPNLARVAGLSVERVRNELQATLIAPWASVGLKIMMVTGLLAAECRNTEQRVARSVPILPELGRLPGLPQNARYHKYDVWTHTLATVDNVPAAAALRWAALLHDVAKGWPGVRTVNKYGQPSDPGHERVGAEVAEQILLRLKVSSAVTGQVAWLIRRHLILPVPEEKKVLGWLRRLARDFRNIREFRQQVDQLLELHRADRLAGHTMPDIETLDRVKELVAAICRQVPFYPGQLSISGKEIAARLGTGPQVGKFQLNLLERIQTGELANTRDSLLAALTARLKRQPVSNQD
ncbi:MAG TPA: HD domain-containing protein [Methylomusa anaerophila]|uniref:CCA-adding enzyme n=1 Tax=Methylomusa anaerophila TaxID=1930071 RepID=A0A348AIR7_9FIRM|nr:HD domain-containing protein [Methylomusa anaerophila]BBB90965.1 CCA-adding enzyme [Methylomusa anaerophila]HML90408.1 HD domain-containing protein [Methylomusa anaerophila]